MQVSLQINWNFLVFPNEDTQDQMPSPLNIELSKKKKSLDNHIKIPLFSLLHALLRLPSSVSFPHLLKQIEKDSFQLIYFTFSTSPSHSFSPHAPVSLLPKKKKKDSANKRWHGLSGKTNENDNFQLPTNNILLSQRSRSIFSHL